MGIREKKGKTYNGGTANYNVDVERKVKKQGHYGSTRNNSKKNHSKGNTSRHRKKTFKVRGIRERKGNIKT